MIHGESKKKKQELTAEEKLKQDQQAQKVLQTISHFFQVRKKEVEQPEDLLAYTQLVAKLCPEIYTIYNLRREILLEKLENADHNTAVQLLNNEFDLINMLLKRHPKSYTLWNHRQWAVLESEKIDKRFSEENTRINAVKKEFKICEKMLTQDERNFHVWNYRQWLVSISDYSQEEQFTLKKIEQNFSNFSAYHFRSKYFLRVHNSDEHVKSRIEKVKELGLLPIDFEAFKNEMQLIQQAIFIQPKEHGVYLYHKWLLSVIQPYGVLGVVALDSQTLEIIFNKRVNNVQYQINCKHQIDGDDGFRQIHKIKLLEDIKDITIEIKNNFFDGKEDQTILEEDFSSRFFVPIKITGKLEGDIFIVKEHVQDFNLSVIEQQLDENIQFLEQSEEKDIRYFLLQLITLYQMTIDLKCLKIHEDSYKQSLELCQKALDNIEKLQNNDMSTKALNQLWNLRKRIFERLVKHDNSILDESESLIFDQKQIISWRQLVRLVY